MPRVHRYTNSNGLYIKSRNNGLMTTYQVSPEGIQLLLSHGHGDGSTLSVPELLFLIDRGYAYTRGSGPGCVDHDFVPPPSQKPIRVSAAHPRSIQRTLTSTTADRPLAHTRTDT